MLLQDTIGEHLLEVDKAASEREEVILKQMCIRDRGRNKYYLIQNRVQVEVNCPHRVSTCLLYTSPAKTKPESILYHYKGYVKIL